MEVLTASSDELEEVIKRLSDTGRQTLLTIAKSLLKNGHAKSPDEVTWTGYFRSIEREGKILFPEWG